MLTIRNMTMSGEKTCLANNHLAMGIGGRDVGRQLKVLAIRFNKYLLNE